MITTGIQRISSFNTDCCGYFWFNSYWSLFALKFYKVNHWPDTLSVFNHPLTIAKSLTWLERKLNLNEIAHFHINWKDLNVWEASVSACYLPRCFRMARGRGPIGSLEFYWIKLETLVFGQQGFVWVIWSWQRLSPWELLASWESPLKRSLIRDCFMTSFKNSFSIYWLKFILCWIMLNTKWYTIITNVKGSRVSKNKLIKHQIPLKYGHRYALLVFNWEDNYWFIWSEITQCPPASISSITVIRTCFSISYEQYLVDRRQLAPEILP